MWSCPAIDHGVTIFPDGRIRPCCQTSAEYSKPLSEITNPARFQDLVSIQSCSEAYIVLDQLRQEKLFELLPFRQLAIDLTLKNHEYE